MEDNRVTDGLFVTNLTTGKSIETWQYNRILFNLLSKFKNEVKELIPEYIRCKLKISKLSKSKRDAVVQYVAIKSNYEPEFRDLIIKVNQSISNSLSNIKDESINNS